jgi:hypothetical protein
METVTAYLARKHEELKLLNSFLVDPISIQSPRSVPEVIDQKFHLAAALKADHALQDWATMETAWADTARPHFGPFEFKYDYQRADLEVRGPSFYSRGNGADGQVLYAASGMAAISALLLASSRVFSEADILVGPNSYSETIEVIDTYAKHLNRVELGPTFDNLALSPRPRGRILLIDSCTPRFAFEATLRSTRGCIDLIIFDTTCFAGGSTRIGRVLRWAHAAKIPVVMVRSHNKLDSLGIEYGRLGSAVFLDNADCLNSLKLRSLRRLLDETSQAIRLFGGAALPAHFPPYIGGNSYRALTDKRVALMLRNGRRTTRYFSAYLAGLTGELHYAHGLYVTLASGKPLDERQTRAVTEEMCADLGRAGLLLRHAGSFGFDFGAAEWCRDRLRDRYVVRLAVPDLPDSIWLGVIEAVAAWWKAHERTKTPISANRGAASAPPIIPGAGTGQQHFSGYATRKT